MEHSSSFELLCRSVNLTVPEAFERLGLKQIELQNLLRCEKVPVAIQNALQVEAMFPDIPKFAPISSGRVALGLKSVSLFSGAGGLDIGLEQAGFETLFANEIETYAAESLRQNKSISALSEREFDHWFEQTVASQRCYRKAALTELQHLKERLRITRNSKFRPLAKTVVSEADVRSISSDDIFAATGTKPGEVDLIAGGPPCQPFSRAGKREVVECEKGQLFMEFVRLVEGVKPRWFLFENVKGLILHDADIASCRCSICGAENLLKFEMREVVRNNDAIGQFCTKCGNFGSQRIVWHKKRGGSLDIIKAEFERIGYRCHSKVLNAADFGAPQSRERIFIVGSRDGEPFTWPEETHTDPKIPVPSAFPLFGPFEKLLPWTTTKEALFANGHWRYGELDDSKAVLWVKNIVRPHDEPVTWSLNRIAPTVGAHQSAKLAIAPFGVPEEQLIRQQWHVLGRRQGDTPPVFVDHEYLTDAELLALQTFPRSWYLHGTRMERAFQIGNAVPPVLAKAVGQAITNAMGISSKLHLDPKVQSSGQ